MTAKKRKIPLPAHKMNLHWAETIAEGLIKLLKRSKSNNSSRYFVKNRAGGTSFQLYSHDIEFIIFTLITYSKYLKYDIQDSETHVSTQIAADLLKCSRPHLINHYLKSGRLPFIWVGSHRRIRLDHIKFLIREQRKHRVDLLHRLEEEALKKVEARQNLLFLKFMEEKYDPDNPHTFTFDE